MSLTPLKNSAPKTLANKEELHEGDSGMDSYNEHLIAGIAITKGPSEANKFRKAAPKRKRASDEVSWTASRCNRLLRTITSRINILQRLAASNRLPCIEAVEEPLAIPKGAVNSSNHGLGHASFPTPSRDPEWLPSAQKPVKTYAAKKRGKFTHLSSIASSRKTLQDDLGLSTPFVKKMLKPNKPESPLPARDGFGIDACSKLESCGFMMEVGQRKEQMRRNGPRSLPLKPSTTADEAYHHLTTSLASFLRATGPQLDDARKGASSLRSMCLRKIPDYVHDLEEEQLGGPGDEDAGEMTYEIYTELETLGTTSNAGLREVVRAHGIWHLENAIMDKLLPTKKVQELIVVCEQAGAHAEARLLSRAALRASTNRATFQEFLVTHHSRPSLILQSLDHLIGQLNLAPAHTLLEFIYRREHCRMLLKAAISETSGTEIVNLASTLSRTGESQITADTAKQSRGLASQLAAILTAVAVSHGPSAAMYGDVVHRAATVAVLDARIRARMLSDSGLTPFLLASILLQICEAPVDLQLQYAGISELAARLPHKDHVQGARFKTMTGAFGFISEVANVIGRSDTASGDQYLFETTHKLIQAATDEPNPATASLLRRTALDGATAHAEKRQSKESFMFVEEIEDVVLHGARLATVSTPASKPKQDYKWEEGLCEWVATTPAAVGELARVGVVEQKVGLGNDTVETDLRAASDDDTLVLSGDDSSETDLDELAFSVRKPRPWKKRRVDRATAKPQPFRSSEKWHRRTAVLSARLSTDNTLVLSEDASDDELGM